MTVRFYHEFETKNQSPKNTREREDGIINKSGCTTKFFILGLFLCMMVFSIISSNQVTSQFKLFGNIRFEVSYDAKESQKDDGRFNVTVPLSAFDQTGQINTTNAREIQVLLPPEQIQWMINRSSDFDSFYEVPFDKDVKERLYAPADNNGPILDFVVAGFPKCGTTTLMANLAQLAPMPENQDVCTPTSRTVLYAYKNWPRQYGELKNSSNFVGSTIDNSGKLFRSSKCPQFIEEGWVQQFSEFLPKTKLIVGIRHPVLWFVSFWNMQDKKTPYESAGICPCNVNARGTRAGKSECGRCRLSCPGRQLYCLGRARFHLPLARLGKTTLSEEERRILAPHDIDGGQLLVNFNITNPIFLYDQTELREGYLWKELSEYLGVSHIPNSKFKGSVGQGRNYTLCDPLYDDFRSRLMTYSYELSTWLQKYFLPVANNPSRPDVRVADVERLTTIVRSYKKDPCNRLVRTGNGTYVLNYTH